MSFIDLHIHSHYSDGVLSPIDLIEKAKGFGIKTLSLTDHNGIDGIEEMITAGEKQNIKIIPGVEIYTNFNQYHLHLLGYNFDRNNFDLKKALNQLQEQRISVLKNIVRVLKKDKWEIEEKEVFNGPSVYQGLGKVAGILMEGNNFKKLKQEMNLRQNQILGVGDVIGFYFKKYFFLCPETEIPAREAIKLIHQARGKAVLAHPGEHLRFKDWEIIKNLKELGLDGLEAISSHHSWAEQDYWQRIAKEFNLFITCGSDYHGDLPLNWGVLIFSLWEYFKTVHKFEEIAL